MDFLEVKCLHEVVCTTHCLIFFRNLFKISKTECVSSTFFNDVYKLFKGNSPGQKSIVIYFGKNIMGGWVQLSSGSCSWRNYSKKSARGQKSRGQLPWEEFHWGKCPGGISCPEGECPDIINYNAVFLTFIWLICLLSQSKFVSKLILYSARDGMMMTISI